MKRDDLRYLMGISYRLIVASVPLLEFAIQYADGPLREYYEHHMTEEEGHDQMLLADLNQFGEPAPHSFVAAQLAGAQYYFIAHVHPAMLLGYMYALESNTATPEMVDGIESEHGIKLTALRHHAEHDPEHRKDLMAMIVSLPDDLRALVMWNHDEVMKVIHGL